MMRKKDNKDWVLVALLLLALVGRGPLATPPAPKAADPTMPPGDTTPRGTDSPGKNSSPPDNGVNTKNAPGDPNIDPNAGTPDKSKSMSPPGGPGMMPTFMIPPGMNIANFINPLPPTGGTKLPGGNVFIPGLTDTGFGMGGPGAGATTPSITTRYGETTYTNFNPALFTGMNPKTGGPTIPEMVKQPMPPMMMPMQQMNPPPGIMFPGGPPGPIIPVVIPPPTMYEIALQQKQVMPPMMMPMQPPAAGPMITPSGQVVNPLTPKSQTLDLSQIFAMFGGFGQDALSFLQKSGMSLTNLFSMLPGIAAAPGVPQFGTRPLLPDITV